MTTELRPEIVTPTHTHAVRLAATALGCALVGAGLMLALAPPAPAQLPAPELALRESLTSPLAVPVVVAVEPPPPARLAEVSLVFRAGGSTYMKVAGLGDDGEAMPRHGTPRLSEDEYIHAATAAVADRDVPVAYRPWRGKRVVVDGTCAATVTGFAVVARLTGKPDYAGAEAEGWTARSVLEYGTPVLAARLDGCTGTYARAASLSPVVIPQLIEDQPLAAAARRTLLASPAALRAQEEWEEAGEQGAWHAGEYAESTTKILRHPRTGETFASVQVRYPGGCGDVDLNVWGLYRAELDGTLTEVGAELGDITIIDSLIDLDDDGRLEVIGRPWLGTGTIIHSSEGDELGRLQLPFYGCSC